MPPYRLTSRIHAAGLLGHHVTVSAIAADDRIEEVRTDIAPTIREAEARRDYLLVSLEAYLVARGHEVADAMDPEGQ
jgi:hypothetical protein